MLILILVTACFWFGVGMLVAWQRSKCAYRLRLERSSAASPVTNDISTRRSARVRAVAVFFGWTIAGLLGAVIWAGLWLLLFLAHMEAESNAQSRSGRKGGGDLWAWVILGGLFVIKESGLHSIEEEADDFVIWLAVVITILVIIAVGAT